MTGLPALSVHNLCFNYGDKFALKGVSFAIKPGSSVILLGPNGAGKTTLFSLVCGLYAPHEGDITIGGLSARRNGAAALAPLGVVFQAQTLDLDLTVRQNLRYFCSLRGLSRAEADECIDAELTHLEMRHRIDEKVRALNGGHRRRVEIARATLHKPAVLLLDEPTVGLDIPTRSALIDHLHARSRTDRTALLWATHLIDEIYPEDRVLVMNNGHLVADGKPGELVELTGGADLSDAFWKLTDRGEDGEAVT